MNVILKRYNSQLKAEMAAYQSLPNMTTGGQKDVQNDYQSPKQKQMAEKEMEHGQD